MEGMHREGKTDTGCHSGSERLSLHCHCFNLVFIGFNSKDGKATGMSYSDRSNGGKLFKQEDASRASIVQRGHY